MNKDFAPYQPSLDMKGLGFDEPCFGYYENDVLIFCYDSKQDYELLLKCAAPLYQQAFRWFREKYGLIGEIFSQLRPSSKFMYGFKIGGSDIIFDGFNTYEEAELECLKKLIEIVKEKQ